jgi:hypothetical protein
MEINLSKTLVLAAFFHIWSASLLAQLVPASVIRSDPVVVERAAHEQRIEYTTTSVDSEGAETIITNSFVQLQTGLNRWNEQLLQYVPANAEIEFIDGHGVVQNTQHRAVFSQNITDPNGTIDLLTPGGDRLVTQPIGIAVTDNTGNSVFLGEVKETEGLLFDPQTFVYPHAFDQYQASIAVRSKLSGIESDVILEERIDRALINELGIDPLTARLEIWHRVLVKPEARIESRMIQRLDGRADRDDTIHFKGMSITPGFAFHLGAPDQPIGGDPGIPVAKEWVTIGNLDFLIESVPFPEAEAALNELPPGAHARIIDKERLNRAYAQSRVQPSASITERTLVKSFPSRTPGEFDSGRKRPVAVAAYVQGTEATSTLKDSSAASENSFASEEIKIPLTALRGFAIDYTALTIQSNYTLKGDTTYWVTGDVNLSGKTTLEGGAVIKFTNYTSTNPVLRILGDFECNTSPYNVAIFTAKDDNTVGETISGSSGTPLTSSYYAWFNLWFQASGTNVLSIHDIHSRYSHVGIGSSRTARDRIWNVQIYNCFRGIESLNGDLSIRNVLLHKTRYAFNTGSAVGRIYDAEHLTISDTLRVFLTGATNNCSLRITNSLLANVTTNDSTGIVSNSVYTVTSSAFKSLGRGNHYLADSTYRNIGNPSVSTEMQAILRQTTTYAPIHLTNDFFADTTLVPIVQRDTDLPDIGYHYDPLDYLLGERNVTNAILTLTNGVALGVYGTNGIILRNGSKLYSTGRPDGLNTLVRYQSVQEDPTTALGAVSPSTMSLIRVGAPSTDPEVQFRFTRANLLANTTGRRHFLYGYTGTELVSNFRITDSQFANSYHYYDAQTNGPAMKITWLNNCLLRPGLTFYRPSGGGYYIYDLEFRNNLTRNGFISFANFYPATSWAVTDNLFDTVNLSGGSVSFPESYNAYHGTTPLNTNNVSNRLLSSCDFIVGPLGSYYYPTSGGNLSTLINAGSRTAASAGLSRFTVSAAPNSSEGSTTVDVGFHYASSDADSNLTDSDSDGIPDYLEDTDGDNGIDSGETNPGSPTDFGLKVFITEPKGNSNIL